MQKRAEPQAIAIFFIFLQFPFVQLIPPLRWYKSSKHTVFWKCDFDVKTAPGWPFWKRAVHALLRALHPGMDGTMCDFSGLYSVPLSKKYADKKWDPGKNSPQPFLTRRNETLTKMNPQNSERQNVNLLKCQLVEMSTSCNCQCIEIWLLGYGT